MKVIKHKWKWHGSLSRRSGKPPKIVWHNSGSSSGTIEAFHAYHQSLGWLGVAYHYVVYKNGEIHKGRPDWAMGGHCYNHNDCIGVCAVGNYESSDKTMPAAQLKALQQLHDYLRDKYHVGDRRHCDMPDNSTACPGRYYPFKKIVAGVPKKSSKIALTDKDITVPRQHKPHRQGWWNLGLVPYIKSLRAQGSGKRVNTKRKDDRITIPVPKTKPKWWSKMLAWRKSQRKK